MSCSSAIQCLAVAMTVLGVPETLKIGTAQNYCEGNGGYTLKETIMKWLLFCRLEEDMEDRVELAPILCR